LNASVDPYPKGQIWGNLRKEEVSMYKFLEGLWWIGRKLRHFWGEAFWWDTYQDALNRAERAQAAENGLTVATAVETIKSVALKEFLRTSPHAVMGILGPSWAVDFDGTQKIGYWLGNGAIFIVGFFEPSGDLTKIQIQYRRADGQVTAILEAKWRLGRFSWRFERWERPEDWARLYRVAIEGWPDIPFEDEVEREEMLKDAVVDRYLELPFQEIFVRRELALAR